MEYKSLSEFILKEGTEARFGGIPSAVYLGPTSDNSIYEYMQGNYDRIFPIIMENLEIPLYFLPLSFKRGHLSDCLGYNLPQIDPSDYNLSAIIEKFNTIISEKNNIKIGAGGIALMDFNDPTKVLDFYPIDSSKDVSPQMNEWIMHILKKTSLKFVGHPNPSMTRGKVCVSGNDIIVEAERRIRLSFSKDLTPRSSDEEFDEHGYNIAREVKERIDILKERGFMKLLAELMEEMKVTVEESSRLRITKEYTILLSDWGNREIKMPPLSKAIYILFLNHPEGIFFKDLIDYREEIKHIYKSITLRENIDDIEQSIDALVDPMNNSINEKCSRIRSAFLEVVGPNLVLPYIISGKRAEAKRVTLNREMLTMEK